MLKFYKTNINFFLIFYFIYYLFFCFVNLKYTQYGKLFFLYILFFFILIILLSLIKNNIFRSFIYAFIIIFILQPPYIYIENYLKNNKINTFQKNISFSYTLDKDIINGIDGLQNISTDRNGFRTLKLNNQTNDKKKKVHL